MRARTTAAAIVPQSHVSLTTQALVLDSGHHLLALQTAVARKVSGEKKFVENVFLILMDFILLKHR